MSDPWCSCFPNKEAKAQNSHTQLVVAEVNFNLDLEEVRVPPFSTIHTVSSMLMLSLETGYFHFT